MSLKITKVWPLEKYARLLPDSDQPILPQSDSSKKGGCWKHFQSSKEGVIHLALLESNHFIISCGSHIYESFSLWNAQKWMKGITKGDSILLIRRQQEGNLRFRIKFAKTASAATSLATCRDCIRTLEAFFPISEMTVVANSSSSAMEVGDSQIVYEDSQVASQTYTTASSAQTGTLSTSVHHQEKHHLTTATNQQQQEAIQVTIPSDTTATPSQSNLLSVPDIAKAIQSEQKSLGGAYAATNFPTGQLGAFIRLCLTDSNFPGFVEAVEKELNSITQ